MNQLTVRSAVELPMREGAVLITLPAGTCSFAYAMYQGVGALERFHWSLGWSVYIVFWCLMLAWLGLVVVSIRFWRHRKENDINLARIVNCYGGLCMPFSMSIGVLFKLLATANVS